MSDSLPKIQYPLTEVDLPIAGKKIKVRPLVTREEKILLMAKTTGDENDILPAIKQVVNNCIATKNVDVDQLALVDLEYAFVRLRSVSINNVTRVSFRDTEDDKVYDFDVNLDEVVVVRDETVDNKIAIQKDVILELSWPTAGIYDDKSFLAITDPNAIIDELALRCTRKVYNGDKVIPATSFTREELKEWLESLDVKTSGKIREFFNKMPRLSYTIRYKNSLGNERTIELRTLSDFFIL
jgi:hypothetical protein